MAIAWYIVPYGIKAFYPGGPQNVRYLKMNDYTDLIINIDGGNWTETEVLGNRAIIKVKASESTLTTLNGVFKRIPKDRLNDSLSDLSTVVKQALKNEALDMGYTVQEIQAKLPNDLGTYTLKDVLKMFATKRKKSRYDSDTDTIYFDGTDQKCRSIESVDNGVQ